LDEDKKSISQMNKTELVKYLNERKSSIENQISRAKT
jgi:hypothetical protein